jgi:NAD(P)-dependent dehydrogenase (short-subunit alcohol dehydrogenase family)
MKEFSGKVAVITGAGRGIGRGIALRCAKEGMKIVLAGIGMESLTRTEADLKALGAETLIVQTDVSKLEDVENLAEKSFDTFDEVHLLVNNAGVASPGSVLGNSMEDWNWVMGVNFYGVLHGVRSFIPRMKEQDTMGHVVNVSSLSGVISGGGSYGVSKHAVVVLTESLYVELANTAPNIKISVYCPGWVSTEFDTIERSRPERFKSSISAPPLTAEQRAGWRESLAGGLSIEKSADVLFEGLENDRLYIGPKAFQSELPELADLVRQRAENMVNERNPELPSVSED